MKTLTKPIQDGLASKPNAKKTAQDEDLEVKQNQVIVDEDDFDLPLDDFDNFASFDDDYDDF